MASISRRGRGWIVRWRDTSGRQHTRTCPSKDVANRLLRHIDEERALGRDWAPQSDRAGSPVDLILADSLERYVVESRETRAEATAIARARRLELFERFAEEAGITIASMSKSTLVAFMKWLRLRPSIKNEGTLYKYVRCVEMWWRWAADDDDQVPRARRLELRTAPRKQTVAPTWKEMDAVIHACLDDIPPRMRNGGHRPNIPLHRLMVVLRFTGLRVQQAMGLVWNDLDLRHGKLTVRTELCKTREEQLGRTVPISPHLVKLLKAWKQDADDDPWVVPSCRTGATPRLARQRDACRTWA